MASVKELFESRVGSSIGSAGVNLTRLFLVLTDNRDDDPVYVLQNDRAGVPYQQVNPWNLSAQAINYAIQRKLGHMAWVVAVGYEMPVTLAPGDATAWFPGWELRTRSGGEQQRLLQELPNPENAQDVPRIVGPNHYEEAGEEDTATHATWKRVGNLNQQVGLVQFPTRAPVGWTRSLPSMEVTLTRDVPGVLLNAVFNAHAYLQMVNDDNFGPGGPGHVRFESIVTVPKANDPEATAAGGRQRRAIRVPVGTPLGPTLGLTLVFKFSVNPLDQLPQTHVWQDNKGAQSLVYPAGTAEPVVENFRVGVRTSFMAILRMFA